MNADTTYLNGISIGSSGRFPPEFKSAWSQFRSYKILPSQLKKGKNVIALRVYFDSEAWIMGPIRIIDYQVGAREKMLADLFRIHGIQAMSISLLGLFIFFLYLYIRRRKETYYLYFSFCSLSLAFTMALCFMENLYPDVGISSNKILKFTQPGLLFFPPLLAIFYRSYCNVKIHPALLFFFLLLPFAGTLLMVFSHERYDILFFRNIFLLTIFIYMIDLIQFSIRQIIRRNKAGLLMFIALIPTVALGAVDILAFTVGIINTSMALYLYGVPAMIFIFALHIVNRFVTSLNQTEKLNIALRDSLVENMRLAALERELDIARKIQLSNLSRAIPSSPYFDIAVKYVPAEKIGGDYYNFHMPAPHQIGVLISDVSGHGVPAALIASMLNVLAGMFAHLADRPDLLLTEINKNIMGNIENQFITTAYAFIDYEAKILHYARAGHLPLYLIRNGTRAIEEFLPRGRAIGLCDNNVYHVNSIAINSGDRIIFYTDCAIEAFNKEKTLFGEERFKHLLLHEAAKSPHTLSELVCRELHSWSNGSLEDDLTLIIIDIR
jgi:serine phosphatase RsbU (regulator of sigma subunit)